MFVLMLALIYQVYEIIPYLAAWEHCNNGSAFHLKVPVFNPGLDDL